MRTLWRSGAKQCLEKGLTFDFFSDTLVRKATLVTVQCADSIITSSSTHGKDTVLPRRTTWTAKMLSATDDRLQEEAFRVLDPIYKEIGACFMGDGLQSTSNRPILNILVVSNGFINVRHAFDVPDYLSQNRQSARVFTSGRHGVPQVYGHSIRK